MTDPARNNTTNDQTDLANMDDFSAIAQPVVPYAKARRYLGLLITIGLMTFMFWQAKTYPKGISNFVLRTNLTAVIEESHRGQHAKNVHAFLGRCSYAQQIIDDAVDPETRSRAVLHAKSACNIEPILSLADSTMDRLRDRDPKFFDFLDEYRSLVKSELTKQGLSYGQIPEMTPEISEVTEQLLKPLIEEAIAAEKWVARMVFAMHALVLIVGIWGIKYRQALGSIAIAPLGWVFGLSRSGAKVAHEIHKKI